MREKRVAILNIGKVLLGASFTTLAAVGSAIGGVSGNASSAALWAGLSALPAASLSAYGMIADQVSKLRSKGEDNFDVPAPHWWANDARSWQNICAEIETHFPTILQDMSECLRQDQRVKTTEVVQQCFINALTMQHLTWAPDSEERRRIGATVVLPILQKMKEVLEPVITQIQQEEAFTDIRALANNTSEAVQILKEMRDAAKPHMLRDEEIAPLRQQYCDVLYTQWKMLDFRGIKHAEMNRALSIPLTEVFICPDVLVGVPEYGTVEREDEQEQKVRTEKKAERNWEEEKEQEALRDLRLKKEKRTILQREELQVVVAKNQYLVILGDPGAGKSTLLRYLLLQLVHGRETFIGSFPQLASLSSILPLYILTLTRFSGVSECGNSVRLLLKSDRTDVS